MITFHECAHESMNRENHNKMNTMDKIETGTRSRTKPRLDRRPKEGKEAARKLRIEFHDEKSQAVFIAGTFNDWHPDATPMICLGDGRWVKELMLPPGRYEYRLVVDGQWICDPAAAEQVPNPHGS